MMQFCDIATMGIFGICVAVGIGAVKMRKRRLTRRRVTAVFGAAAIVATSVSAVAPEWLFHQCTVPPQDDIVVAHVSGDASVATNDVVPSSDDVSATVVTEGPYTVRSVVDGDTMKIERDGRLVTVRIIGINTPESVDRRRAVECFGKEAAARATQALLGASVTLERDTTQADTDRYGRLLRHVVFADGRQFGEMMIAEGFAYEYTYDAPYAYQQRYKDAQSLARQQQRGMWAPDACAAQSPASNVARE